MHLMSTSSLTIVSDFNRLQTLTCYERAGCDEPLDFQFLPNSSLFLQLSRQYGLELLRIKKNQDFLQVVQIKRIAINDCRGFACAKSSSDDFVLALPNGTIQQYSLWQHKVLYRFPPDSKQCEVIQLELNCSDEFLASVYANGQFKIFNVKAKDRRQTIEEGEHKWNLVRFHATEKSQIGMTSDRGMVTLYDLECKQKLFKTHSGHALPCRDLAFCKASPFTMVSVGYDCLVKIYDVRCKKDTLKIVAPYPLTAVAIHEAGHYFCLGNSKGDVGTLDMRSCKHFLNCQKVHSRAVNRLAFLPSSIKISSQMRSAYENKELEGRTTKSAMAIDLPTRCWRQEGEDFQMGKRRLSQSETTLKMGYAGKMDSKLEMKGHSKYMRFLKTTINAFSQARKEAKARCEADKQFASTEKVWCLGEEKHDGPDGKDQQLIDFGEDEPNEDTPHQVGDQMKPRHCNEKPNDDSQSEVTDGPESCFNYKNVPCLHCQHSEQPPLNPVEQDSTSEAPSESFEHLNECQSSNLIDLNGELLSPSQAGDFNTPLDAALYGSCDEDPSVHGFKGFELVKTFNEIQSSCCGVGLGHFTGLDFACNLSKLLGDSSSPEFTEESSSSFQDKLSLLDFLNETSVLQTPKASPEVCFTEGESRKLSHDWLFSDFPNQTAPVMPQHSLLDDSVAARGEPSASFDLTNFSKEEGSELQEPSSVIKNASHLRIDPVPGDSYKAGLGLKDTYSCESFNDSVSGDVKNPPCSEFGSEPSSKPSTASFVTAPTGSDSKTTLVEGFPGTVQPADNLEPEPDIKVPEPEPEPDPAPSVAPPPSLDPLLLEAITAEVNKQMGALQLKMQSSFTSAFAAMRKFHGEVIFNVETMKWSLISQSAFRTLRFDQQLDDLEDTVNHLLLENPFTSEIARLKAENQQLERLIRLTANKNQST